jgi:hypothetical protein
MKNVHLLPTDKPSRLIYNDANQLCYHSNKSYKNDRKWMHRKKFNIYITDNSEIKEGDYVVVSCSEIEIEEVRLVIGYYNEQFLFDDRGQIHMDYCKKIILTTDPQLIADGVQPIDNEFLEWFVKNPSCEFVETQCSGRNCIEDFGCTKEGCNGVEPLEIIIPQEELKHPKVFSENGNELFFDEQGNLIREEPKMKLINKDVHEHYCSLELLQLLYDKGMRYREWTDGAFTHNSLAEHRFNQGDVSHLKDTVTHQIVVEWLRVNHGIWVSVSLDLSNTQLFDFEIQKEQWLHLSEGHYDTPKEATEAGIFYVLNNLI